MKLTMNKKKLLLSIILIFVLLFLVFFIIFNIVNKNFYLDEKYYGNNEIYEIDIDKFNELLSNKESFGIFIYQPACSTSADFEQVLYDFLNQNQISIYKIKFSDIYEHTDFLKFYPSFIIYKDGKMIDFLEADKDDDLKYYQSVDGFKEWFTKYVILKEVDNNNNIDKDEDINNDENKNEDNKDEDYESHTNINLDNVIKEDGKVNLYLFWGDGCPHCAEEKKFLKSIENEYGDLFNIYEFEVWHNEENEKIMKEFGMAMEDTLTGVPYTIIGKESIKGFNDSKKEQILNAIINESKSNYDIYFDVIKK